jgi:hypothetical protein
MGVVDFQLLTLVQAVFLIFASLAVVAGREVASYHFYEQPRSHAAPCPSKAHRAGISAFCFNARAPGSSISGAAFKRIPTFNFSARRRQRLSIRWETMSSVTSARQGAEKGSLCTSCYTPQGLGHKFCVSCGAPQLKGGGIVSHWSTEEARSRQFTNSGIGISSCGPASVLTALSMIGGFPDAHVTD